MRIKLLSVGRRMPGWVDAGFREYAKRLPRELALTLVEIDPGHRGKGADRELACRLECARMLARLRQDECVIALDVRGRPQTSEELAQQLATWMGQSRDLALLVGGADGLAGPCLERAQWRWSLAPLTFPHPLVRIILAEQLYRAWTILKGHPYHRE